MEVLGHYLDALGPFLKYYPDVVSSVINKLFELLNSLPFVVKVFLSIPSLLQCYCCKEKFVEHDLINCFLLGPFNKYG